MSKYLNKFTVDLIQENKVKIISIETGQVKIISILETEPEIMEGDVIFNMHNKYITDKKLTLERKIEIDKLAKSIWK